MKPDVFFKRILECSGPSLYCENPEQTLRTIPFFINGLRLQDDAICVELLDRESNEFEFFISIDDLLDGFEEFIKFSNPNESKEFKANTITALTMAIERIKVMKSDDA